MRGNSDRYQLHIILWRNSDCILEITLPITKKTFFFVFMMSLVHDDTVSSAKIILYVLLGVALYNPVHDVEVYISF